jgi:hypothetical protein
MPLPQEQIAWLAANRERVVRWMCIPQLLVALLFGGFAYRTGRDHGRLLLMGLRTQGVVIGLKPVVFYSKSDRSSFSRTSYMPIVKFRAGDHFVQFQEWKSAPSDPGVGSQVIVLYDPSDTSIAMMDRGALNWLPWAPCAAIGLFLALVGLKGLVCLLTSRRAPGPLTRTASV